MKLNSAMTKIFMKKYDTINRNHKSEIRKYGKKIGAITIIDILSAFVLEGGLYLYFGWRICFAQMSLSTFYMLYEFSQMLPVNIYDLFNTFSSAYKNALYVDDIKYILEYKSKIYNPRGIVIDREHAPAIELSNVSFKYVNGNKNVLNGLSLSVRSGEKVAIVGRNGAGKTTLTKLISGIYAPDSGEITVNGYPIKDINVELYQDMISLVPQDPQIYGLSVYQNVFLNDDEKNNDEAFANGLFEKFDLTETISAMPQGMNNVLTKEFEGGVDLSGGEKQKIALCRALAKDSKMIIFDEPSSSLDAISEHKLWEYLLDVCNDKTALFITHRLANVIKMDRIIVIDDGAILEEGTHNQLMDQNGLYAEMFKMQSEGYLHNEDS